MNQPNPHQQEQITEEEFKLEMLIRDLTRESCQPSPCFKKWEGEK